MSDVLNHIVFGVLVLVMVGFSIIKRRLTPAAALTGSIIALSIYAGMQLTGLAMLGAFFIGATAATAWQRSRTTTRQDADPRTTSQVLANGGMAAFLGLLCFIFPQQQVVFSIMLTASLSTATADTLSSELGTLYGSRFVNILTLKPDSGGLDGVISLEGLVIGIAGSCLIATIYIVGTSLSLYHFIIIVTAGTLGNISDSLLGASFERRKKLGNDAVNFIATFIGAVIAGVWFIVQ